MSHSTPGECSAIGSLEPSTSNPSPSGCNRIGNCPNSGRGANSTLARPVPDSRRISEEPMCSGPSPVPISRPVPGPLSGWWSNQSVTVSPDQRVSTVIVPGR